MFDDVSPTIKRQSRIQSEELFCPRCGGHVDCNSVYETVIIYCPHCDFEFKQYERGEGVTV